MVTGTAVHTTALLKVFEFLCITLFGSYLYYGIKNFVLTHVPCPSYHLIHRKKAIRELRIDHYISMHVGFVQRRGPPKDSPVVDVFSNLNRPFCSNGKVLLLFRYSHDWDDCGAGMGMNQICDFGFLGDFRSQLKDKVAIRIGIYILERNATFQAELLRT